MQNVKEIQVKVFDDAKSIIEALHHTNSPSELINHQENFQKLYDLLNFLRISDYYSTNDDKEIPLETFDNQQENSEITQYEFNEKDKYIAEEEVIFNNELNQIHESEIHHPESVKIELEEEAVFNNHLNEIEAEIHQEHFTDTENEEISSQSINEERHNKTDSEIQPPENINSETTISIDENRGKILEINRIEKQQNLNDDAKEMRERHLEEKKFRLANIKGIKKIQSLFGDDDLEEDALTSDLPTESSIVKSNVSTDFMEAQKPKPEFKLDLNDRISFSKMLFNGSQSELHEAVHKLNSFQTLNDAKEYLSEIYHEKNWKNADEYAQRLWNLVENKFM